MKKLFILALISLCSCNFLYKTIFGIKNPQMESYHSINEYSKKFAIDSSAIVFAKDSVSQMKLHMLFSRTPDMIIFDSQKRFIPYKNDSATCNASIDDILKNICSYNSTVKTNKNIDFDLLFSCVTDPNKCFTNFDLRNYRYVVLMNYTKYMDGVNKTHLIPWNKIITDHKDSCKVKYVFVNLDYLKIWGMKSTSLPKVNLTTK
jgi:hypothetical protein